MDEPTIRAALCEVITEIQTISGLDCPSLSGSTKPARDVKGFVSEVWPIAISMLQDKISVEIAEDENLFYDDKTRKALSIDECVQKVLPLIQKNNSTVKIKEAEYE